MKVFELVVTEKITFQFFLPLSNNETLLSQTKSEKNFRKPNIRTIATNQFYNYIVYRHNESKHSKN